MSDLTDRLRCFDRQTCTEAAERIETLEAELAAMRAGGEPVAQISGIDEYGPMLGWFKHWKDVAIGTRLYTHPQPAAQDAERKPLSKEQRAEIMEEVDSYNFPEDLIDATEKAHGIKGGQHDV